MAAGFCEQDSKIPVSNPVAKKSFTFVCVLLLFCLLNVKLVRHTTNNVKKPQSQMCESCRKLDLRYRAARNLMLSGTDFFSLI